MLNSGDTSWLLISAALVLLMTPGVAFFYSGLVSTRSAVNTISMCFICLAVVPIIWTLCGYSFVFTKGSWLIGAFEWGNLYESDKIRNHTPANAFMVFQMMFAVISPALIAGALVGRMRFRSYVIFVALWSLIVYTPIAHWVWGPDGWILNLGAIDFAGGTVVHINAGFAALVAAIVLGPRLRLKEKSWTQTELGAPHNVPFVVLGASLLWFGWYGFNAGSALAADGLASIAFLTTTLSTSSSILTWTFLTWFKKLPTSAVGSSTAAIIGLVAITPAAGFVTPTGAIFIGICGALVCHLCMRYRSIILKNVDDTLDVFICHGVSGVTGALLTGLLATKSVNVAGADGLFYGNPMLFIKQCIAVVAVIATTMILTWLILAFLKLFMEIRPTPEEEIMGIDKIEHAESAYKRLKKKKKSMDS